MTDDNVDALLDASREAAAERELHERVFAQTLAVMRRRRRMRRLGWAAALAACAALGACVAWFLKPGPETEPPRVELPKAAPQTPDTPKTAEPAPPLAVEWKAFDAGNAERVRLYREAGDRYLNEANDVEGALRCYRQALDAGTEADLRVNLDDSWLLIALKDARRKEKADAAH